MPANSLHFRWFSDTVVLTMGDAEKEEILDFITKVRENSQVYDSNKLSAVLWKIRSRNIFTNDELNALFQSNGLERFVYNPIMF